MFAFPLIAGSEAFGALDLYCAEPRELRAGQFEDALLVADLAALAVNDETTEIPDVGLATEGTESWAYPGVVHQATGMISERLGIPVDEALLRLRPRGSSVASPSSMSRAPSSSDGCRSSRGPRMTERRHPAPVDRERAIIDTFVRLSDTLVDSFDVIDFLHFLTERCVALVDVDESGVMLATPAGTLQAVAASSEQTRLLELFEVQNHDGPCLDAYRTGGVVVATDLTGEVARWPMFAPRAVTVGFNAVHSVPLRLRNEVIGALNLLRAAAGALSTLDAALVRALADIATVGVLQHRAMQRSATTVSGLQTALTSRIRIEQAKGILAERAASSVDDAFEMLRRYARSRQIGITATAEQVVAGTFDISRPPPD